MYSTADIPAEYFVKQKVRGQNSFFKLLKFIVCWSHYDTLSIFWNQCKFHKSILIYLYFLEFGTLLGASPRFQFLILILSQFFSVFTCLDLFPPAVKIILAFLKEGQSVNVNIYLLEVIVFYYSIFSPVLLGHRWRRRIVDLIKFSLTCQLIVSHFSHVFSLSVQLLFVSV